MTKKDKWIRAARKNFHPGERKNCCICHGCKSITQAHHTYPLSKQFDDGIDTPIQEFVWLCPEHHNKLREIGITRQTIKRLKKGEDK